MEENFQGKRRSPPKHSAKEVDPEVDIDILTVDEDPALVEKLGQQILDKFNRDLEEKAANELESKPKRRKKEYNPQLDVQVQATPSEVHQTIYLLVFCLSFVEVRKDLFVSYSNFASSYSPFFFIVILMTLMSYL